MRIKLNEPIDGKDYINVKALSLAWNVLLANLVLSFVVGTAYVLLIILLGLFIL